MHLERLIRLPPLLRVFLIALLAGSLALTGLLAAWLLRDEPAPVEPDEGERHERTERLQEPGGTTVARAIASAQAERSGAGTFFHS